MKEILDTQQYFNSSLIRNNRIFAGTILFFQTLVIILYAFFVSPTPTLPNKNNDLLIFSGTAVLVLIGFGLHFSIARNRLWSTLGFNLLIVAVSFQLYFLASPFWHFIGIGNFSSGLTWQSRFPVYLTDSNNNIVKTYGITAVQALKCSLANIIAFSAISGRAGPLQAFIISVFGTFLYELNRQLISRWSLDNGGSMAIFTFAGFYGSIISIILYALQRNSFKNHPFRVASKFSFVLSGVGALFCWVFFAFLNLDMPSSNILFQQAGINTFFCISSCVVMTIILSCIVYGKLDFKEVIYSPIVGGVVIGSSSAVINNVLGSLILGSAAALVFMLLMSLFKKLRWHFVVQNYVHVLFALMGTGGGLISPLFVSEAHNNNGFNTLLQNYLPTTQNQFIGVGLSIAIGLFGGLLVSPIINFVNEEGLQDHYHDQAYWIIEQDGISMQNHVQNSTEQSSIVSQLQSGSQEPQNRYYKKEMISNGSSNQKENSEL